jgi:TolA-binding protein
MTSQETGSTGWYDFQAWLEVNKKPLAVAVAVLLALLAVWYVNRWRGEQAELAANHALLQLRPPAGAPAGTPAAPPAAFLDLASRYSGTSAGERALLLGAGALFAEGQYAEAEAQFSRFLSQFSGSPMASQAAFGVAASLEAQGKADQALAAYQNVITRYPRAVEVEEARMSTARLYEAQNQPQQALRVYDELIRGQAQTAGTPRATEVSVRRQQLLARHPELAPPAAAVSETTSAPAVPVN